MKKAEIKAIVFDLDGTLIDTMGAFADLAAEVMHKHFGMPHSQARQRYLDTSGVPFTEQLGRIFPSQSVFSEVNAEFEAGKVGILHRQRLSKPYRELLSELRRRGIWLAISSNSAQHFVDQFDQDHPDVFDLALGYTSQRQKGHGHFSIIQKALLVDSASLMFVGDSLSDAQIAQDNHVRFTACLGTCTAKQFTDLYPTVDLLEDLTQLPRFLRGSA